MIAIGLDPLQILQVPKLCCACMHGLHRAKTRALPSYNFVIRAETGTTNKIAQKVLINQLIAVLRKTDES